MNAAERLRAIIKERREWEAFGWGPLLAGWAAIVVAKGLVELVTGPNLVVGTIAYALGLIIQGVLALVLGARPGVRQVTMHGLWTLVAVSAWFFGTGSLVLGSARPEGAAVLELLFLASGLVMTGFIKERRVLVLGAVALAVGALGLALFPVWAPAKALVVAATFGTASLVAWRNDSPPAPLSR